MMFGETIGRSGVKVKPRSCTAYNNRALASMRYETNVCLCLLYVTFFLFESSDEMSRVVEALPQAISFVG